MISLIESRHRNRCGCVICVTVARPKPQEEIVFPNYEPEGRTLTFPCRLQAISQVTAHAPHIETSECLRGCKDCKYAPWSGSTDEPQVVRYLTPDEPARVSYLRKRFSYFSVLRTTATKFNLFSTRGPYLPPNLRSCRLARQVSRFFRHACRKIR